MRRLLLTIVTILAILAIVTILAILAILTILAILAIVTIALLWAAAKSHELQFGARGDAAPLLDRRLLPSQYVLFIAI